MLRTVAVLITIGTPVAAFAHGGGLNASGCHNDRKSGGYHCHAKPTGSRIALSELFAGRGSIAPATRGAYYPNCAAVRAAGAAPIRSGQDGYSRKLDRDGDGIACE